MASLDRTFARPWASALVAAASVVIPTLLLVAFATEVWASYGWTLFVFGPVVLGFTAAWLHGRGRPCALGASLGVAMLAVLFAGLGLLALGGEGAICLLMASPLAAPGAALGALLAHAAMSRKRPARLGGAVALAWLSLPGAAGLEPRLLPPPPAFTVRSSVEVGAPPEVVWRQVVSFPELPPPTDWLFRAGVAYPVSAEIEGAGVGAVRRCVFSTGAFVEPIEVWDEPRRLAFRVSENPPPMREWNPFTEVHPPHLSGFLVSERGEFRLEPLPDGRTLLIGETTYRHGLWPAGYWRLWSDYLIHRIHLQVLEHVRELAEARLSG